MKHSFFNAAAIITAVWVASSCSDSVKKSAQTGDKWPIREVELKQLIGLLPDHLIKEDSEEAFTAEYYSTLKEAFDVPSNAVDEIGDDEFLYYFLSGNGGMTKPTSEITDVTLDGNDKATVTFRYYDAAFPADNNEGSQHTMSLQRIDNRWVVADLDTTLAAMRQYIKTQRLYFRSEEWKDYINPLLDPDNVLSEDAKAKEQEVYEYFRQYPDNN